MQEPIMKQFLRAIFASKSSNTIIQLIRYGFVGGAAFVLDISTLYFLADYCGIHYLVSAAIAFTVGLTTNYLLSIIWVFSSRNQADTKKEFAVFTLVGLFGLGLTELLLWLLTDLLAVHYLYSKLVATAIVFFSNFGLRKILLFRNS